MRNVPTIVLCLLVWMMVIVVGTGSTNQFDFERLFAITAVAMSWFTIGSRIDRIRHPRDQLWTRACPSCAQRSLYIRALLLIRRGRRA